VYIRAIQGLFIVWHLGTARHCLNLSQNETSLYDQPKQRGRKKQTEAERTGKMEFMRREGEKRGRERERDPGSLCSLQ